MKQITLGNGQYALIDDEDLWRCLQHTWCLRGRAGYKYPCTSIKGKIVQLHRWLLGVTDPGILVDHEDRNRLNCQRSNISIVDQITNNMNRCGKINSQQPFKGVRKHYNARGYRATLVIKGKQLHLGCFDDPVQAAKAYDTAAIRHYGKVAFTNFEEVTK